MENYEEHIVEPKYVFEKLGQENFKVIDCTVFIEIKKVMVATKKNFINFIISPKFY